MDEIRFNLTADSFQDRWLYEYFSCGSKHKNIPSDIENALARKLDMLDSANVLSDLLSPPGNKLEKLEPKSSGLYSIRVNVKYRLIFKYEESNIPKITEVRLDKHQYRL
ncbi:TPA: type II toxin-antitoxin system RelE/ParE family toxin [Pasteurella multocida]|nr:type II toxin-antitoxin system RelE/ParE family toxin [Pasteurella multocida]